MNTTTIDVAADRYATVTGPKAGHLLPRAWTPTPGKQGRPSLCGIWRKTWRNTARQDNAADYHACPDCNRAAGIIPADPTPIVPEPRQHTHRADVPIDCRLLAHPVDPQQAHTAMPSTHRALRRTWLPSIPRSKRALDYVGVPLHP